MKNVVIIDYGLSNIHSVLNAFQTLGVSPIVSNNSEDILAADTLVLPGVGAFKDGMSSLSSLGLIEPISQKVNLGTPLLGICLGMQMLFDESEEFGIHKGLSLIPGKVVKIPSTNIAGERQKVPHISWNPLYPANNKADFECRFLETLYPGEECYFIHSYEAKPSISEHVIAETEYGSRRICAIVKKDNIIGIQFHPEKSGPVGMRILESFVKEYC